MNKETTLSKRQRKVYDLLCTGKHSATDITIKLGYSDPRSYIRTIRSKGITLKDEWIDRGDVRYKVYWIAPTMPQKPIEKSVQPNFEGLFPNKYEAI